MMNVEVSTPAAEEVSARLLDLAREISEELHPGRKLKRLTLDSSLDKDLGLDSLGRAELLTRLEKTFDVALPESLVASAETPRDLLRAVTSAGKTPAAAAAELAPMSAPLAEVEEAPHGAATLVEVLEWHAERHPDRRHVAFLSSDSEVEELTYGELYERASRIAAGLEAAGLEPGQMAGLMLPSGTDYFASFFGVLIAGAVPVPLYPPVRPSQLEDHLRRQAGILNTAQARVMIAMPEVLPLARLIKAQIPTLTRVTTVEELDAATAPPRRPVLKPEDVAFLQFTSGSTSDPKGVILTHANLLANLRAIDASIELGSDETVVSWLPLYHDMGLIGAWMGSLYFAMQLVLMSPLAFLTRPARWLKAVHKYRGTLSAAPNFAYELCIKKIDDREIEGLDLSSWRASLNGAEPVSPETIRRFTERFAPYGYKPETMLPVYGLAENSLAVAFPPWGRGVRIDAVDRDRLSAGGEAALAAEDDADALRFVGCGYPLPGHEIRIVDATGAELAERHEGRIQFRGPSATSGYYRNPEATRKLFDGDWLDSGDRGYLAEGEIFITGRAKDMIIRAGRNIYPQEVEEAVGDLEGVRKGCVAVFGSPDPATGTERLIVLAETRETDEAARQGLVDEIQGIAADLAGTPADDVVLVKPHTVPKTSSGKIRRAAGRELYEGRKLGSRGPVWWQVARLALAGAKPQLKRSAQAAGEVLYASRFWLTVGLAALPVAAGVTLLPRLTRRRRAARQAARQLAKLTSMPLRIDGLEHLQGRGPLIVAANHASYLDAFALTAALPTEGAFLAKRELTQSFLARLLLERLGTLFVERFDAEKSVEDTRRALATIRRGESLLFFPEGTFDRAPGLRPFKMGAFHVAAQAGAPVVPVAIRGTRSVLRGDDWFPRRGTITITVRPPIYPEGADLAAAVRLRDQVRKEILAYCGEPDLAG